MILSRSDCVRMIDHLPELDWRTQCLWRRPERSQLTITLAGLADRGHALRISLPLIGPLRLQNSKGG